MGLSLRVYGYFESRAVPKVHFKTLVQVLLSLRAISSGACAKSVRNAKPGL